MLSFPSWKFGLDFKYLFIMSSKSKRKFPIHQQKWEVYYNHKMFESEAFLPVIIEGNSPKTEEENNFS